VATESIATTTIPYGVMLHQQKQGGLYTFGTRYDNPSLGRWTQQDPVGGSLGDLNSANRYTYAGDDPVNAVDSSGRDALLCGLVIAGIIAAAVVGIWLIASAIAAAGPEAAAVGEGLLLSGTEQGIVSGAFIWIGGLLAGIISLIAGACS
jgi:RHS repeat-associated protein